MSQREDSRKPSSVTDLEEEDLEALLVRVADHDVPAWQELWLTLEPVTDAITRRQRVTGRLCTRVDERRDILVRVMEELQEDGFRRLQELLACLRLRDGSFRGWLTTMVKNVAIDHARSHPENLGDKGTFRWAKHAELPADLRDRRRDTFQGVAASEILALAERCLRADQLEVLLLWSTGESYTDIADALQLGSVDDAEHLRRSAVERVRYHLVQEEEEEAGNLENIFAGRS